MSTYDNAGRVHRRAFIVSVLVLFILCIINTCARFYIRIFMQKQVSIDDWFLLFAICCLICAVGILFTFLDQMYLAEALLFGLPGVTIALPPDFIEQTYEYQKLVAVVCILTWCSIISVKFSFLFLFRKLIDRIRPLVIYWRVVVLLNTLVFGYGTSVYIISCPHFYNIKTLQCATLPVAWRMIDHSVAQMVLDVIVDLLILFIPVRIIWKIQIKWTQKIALAFSLCLTVVTIAVTITRASGLRSGNKVDAVWEVFWQFMSAETGIILTAMIAYRSLFKARKGQQAPGKWEQWYITQKGLLQRTFTIRTWTRRSKPSSKESDSFTEHSSDKMANSPEIPRATMTGIRTFIRGHGATSTSTSGTMQSEIMEEDEDTWPSSETKK